MVKMHESSAEAMLMGKLTAQTSSRDLAVAVQRYMTGFAKLKVNAANLHPVIMLAASVAASGRGPTSSA